MKLTENLPKNIEAVVVRLKYFDKLFANRSIFQGEFNYNVDYGFHPYSHFDATLNYLLITCFDALSEREKHIDFGDWIKRKVNKERDDLLLKYSSEESNTPEMISRLYEKYKETFGVIKSIKELVFEKFTEDNRKKLFDSIEVRKQIILKEKPENVIGEGYFKTELVDSFDKKFKYFLDIRNKFTHEAFIHGADDIGYSFSENFKLCDGEIRQVLSNCITIIEEKQASFKEVSLIGWPLIIREIIGDYIYREFNVDVKLKKEVIKEYRGPYNFDLLWSKSEKILWAKTIDDKQIYLGGSTFSKSDEAIWYIDEVVKEAVSKDSIICRAKSLSKDVVISIPMSKHLKFGPIVNVLGYVTSNKGNRYPVRFWPEFKEFLFFDEDDENWWRQPAVSDEISDILEEAKIYIDQVFEK